MAKDKLMEYYRAGFERAYRLYKEEGPEALEKEMRFRNITGINSPLISKEIDAGIVEIKRLTYRTMLTMTTGVLYSEFGFGKKRLLRFKDVFHEAVQSLNDGIVTWADICYNIEDMTGVRVNLIDDLGRNTGMIRDDQGGVGVTDRQYETYRYLSRLWRIDHEIKDKEDELRSIGLVQGVRYDRDTVQTSPSDPMGRVADIIGEIEEEQERYIRVKHQLINEIHGLEDHVYEQILVERFIQKRSIKQIRIRKDYSRSTAYRLFLEALDAFADKYGNKWESS